MESSACVYIATVVCRGSSDWLEDEAGVAGRESLLCLLVAVWVVTERKLQHMKLYSPATARGAFLIGCSKALGAGEMGGWGR